MTDISKLREVFLHEYQATGNNLDAALAAVITATRADVRIGRHGPPRGWARELFPDEPPTSTRLRDLVLGHVAHAFGIADPTTLLRRRAVDPRHAPARWVAGAVLIDLGLSGAAAAKAVGMRHHTSMLYALHQIEERPEIQRVIARVAQEIRAAGSDAVAVDSQPPSTTSEKAPNAQAGAKAPRRPSAVSTLAGEEAA